MRRLLLLTLILACARPAAAATAPAMQARLDTAVLAYEAGRLPAAAAAFEALARRHVHAAEYNLGVMHLRGEVPHGSPQRAYRLLGRAARGGFVTAQLALAQGLENGDFGLRDLAQAQHWYARAAAAGNLEAQLAMGTAFYLGRGEAKDPERAAHWYREAAKAGDIGAMYLLAAMYEQGDGVERDLRLARYWYQAAARGGDVAAPGKVQEMERRLQQPPT